MFNFSANHLVLISRTEYSSHAVFLMLDRDTQRVYRLYDFSQAQLIRPDVAYCNRGQGQQRRQTLPGYRIGSPGHETPPGFHNSCSY
jgi:hypothetical protein